MSDSLLSIIGDLEYAAERSTSDADAVRLNGFANRLRNLQDESLRQVPEVLDPKSLAEVMCVIADRITTRADAYFGICGESDVQRMAFRGYAHELRALASTIATPITGAGVQTPGGQAKLNPAPPTSGAWPPMGRNPTPPPTSGDSLGDTIREMSDEFLATPAQAGAELPEPCEHNWRNSDRHDPMLPSAWVQQCTKCGAYDDDE